jgi:hypothetical protein
VPWCMSMVTRYCWAVLLMGECRVGVREEKGGLGLGLGLLCW